jgi:hypothetical protein
MSDLNLKMDKDFKDGLTDIKKELVELRKSVDLQLVADNSDKWLQKINKQLDGLNNKATPLPVKEVKVNNLDEIKVNQNVTADMKLPRWLDKSPAKPIVESFTRGFEYMSKAIQNILITNKRVNEYIPSRRVYKDHNGVLRFDDSGPLIGGISGGGGGGDVPAAALSGQMTVTAAGTAEVLATDTSVQSVTIKALYTNTGYIYVGNLGTAAAATGFILGANEQVSLDIRNTNLIYIDSSVSIDGVSWIAVR